MYEEYLDNDVEAIKDLCQRLAADGCEYWDAESNFCALYRPAAVPRNKLFEEVVVEYPDPDKCAYQEYKGKPYYSIRYREDGQGYLGFGTYKPEVLSQYLKEYFVHPVEPRTGKWMIDNGLYRCSACKHLWSELWWAETVPLEKMLKLMPYCPNCGAKMENA